LPGPIVFPSPLLPFQKTTSDTDPIALAGADISGHRDIPDISQPHHRQPPNWNHDAGFNSRFDKVLPETKDRYLSEVYTVLMFVSSNQRGANPL